MSADQRARVVGWVLSSSVLAVLVALDLALDPSLAIVTVLFALAPLIACAVLSVRATALVAVMTLLLASGSGWWNGTQGTVQQGIRVLDVALVSGAAVAISVVRVRRERRYSQLAEIAEAAQRAILPVLPTNPDRIEIAARYESAVEGTLVGGDFYDCYHTDAVTRLLIGDVRGKGIAGVEQAARVIRAFRQAAARQPTLVEVVKDMDAYLTPFFDAEEFATAFFVEVIGPDRLAVLSAGHPPALLAHRSGALEPVETAAGLPLGTGLNGVFEETLLTWSPGERLLLYTDGLSEARDEHGAFLDLAALAEPLAAPSGGSALEGVLDAVEHHVPRGRLGDDLALVLLENAA